MLRNILLENILLPTGDLFLGTSFIKDLHYWRNKIAAMDTNELKALQQQRLHQLLQHASNTIPFYQKQDIQLTGNPYADIRNFPIMHKKLMKDNIDLLLIHDKNKMVVEKSSGSSGLQGEVYMTMQENRRYQAVQTFLWEWSGYRIGEPMMQTGMTLKRGFVKGVKDRLFQIHYVNAFELEYKKIANELQQAKKEGCKFFGGYASSLNVYAEVAIKEGIDMKFEGVMSWGDKLFEHYKTNLKNAFGNPMITELYGTTEGFQMTATCEMGHHHIMTPQTYIELLDKDGNDVKPGEIGHVVATRLDAFSFPLIRFHLGDLAIKEDETKTCACGRSFPLMQKIIGRDTDIVHTPSGKALIVHFFTGILEHFETIKQFRVVQKQRELIEIEYIKAKEFEPSTLQDISKTMFEKANEVFNIKYTEVDTIPNTPSGKPQIVQNFLTQKLV